MVTIVDLDIGNLQSIVNAFKRIGAGVAIARTPQAAKDAEVLVLPGVGAFERAINRLNDKGFGPVVQRHVHERRRPLLGICLGMQLLADSSDEHGHFKGLGLIPGNVVPLVPQPPRYRVPNIGWMPVVATKPSSMFPPEVNGQSFYHVHSFHVVCDDPRDVAATFDFGGTRVVTAVERGNVFGVQFHPEKSQDAGLNLLSALLQRLQPHSEVHR